MRNLEKWTASKAVRGGSGFLPTSDQRELSLSSRLVSSRQITAYYGAIRKYAKGRLLDLGCGKVPYYEMYRDLVTENVCVDWEQSLHGNDFIDQAADLNMPLPLSDDSFDTVLMTDVLEHVAKPGGLMTEIGRVLRIGGSAIVSAPFFYWIHEQPHDYFRYSEFALRVFAENSGLRVDSIEPYGGAPEIVADIIGKCVHFAGFPTLAIVHSATSRALLDLGIARRLSARTARAFPLGYVMIGTKVGQVCARTKQDSNGVKE